ncbi:MAG: serpin family protein [Deltaproteobacteria bacterium]|jgi:serpin B|nr:serpin family protein [Deltaproteobacteria bacterium]MBW2537930.1 serpin family protein [Deltaproteobacteria bacterium]
MKRTILVTALACWAACAGALGCNSGVTPTPEPTGQPAKTPTATTAATTTAAPTTSAAAAPSAQPSPDAGGPSEAAVTASNAFGLDLYRRLVEGAGNLAMSPASLSIALSMTYGGAKGDTAKEMAEVMHLPAPDALHGGWATVLSRWGKEMGKVELRVANRLFGEKSYQFEKPFLGLTEDRYAAPLEPRDFKNAPEAQRKYINGWVEERTKKRIVDLIPPPGINSDTRLVLANAIYLKAPWDEPFNDKLTKEGTFYAGGTKEVQVPLMSKAAHMRYADTAEVELVELGYEGRQLAMLIALPKQRAGLAGVEKKLDEKMVRSWVEALKGKRVWLSLPKFKVDPAASLALKPHLQAMGMKLAFLRGKADFTAMTNPKSAEDRLNISNVFHKAFVAVDEKGTEAAAATAVVMARAGAAPVEPQKVVVDHPFLFFIRDVETQALMFVGRVVDPSAS